MTAFLLVFFPFLASAEVCTFSLSFVMNGEHPEVENVQARSSVSHVLGAGRSEDCFWRFPLRSELAQSYFERLQLDMRACSDKPLNIEATGVNHPDSFE